MTPDIPIPSRFHTAMAHPARVYDWLLGGKDNYPVDEAVGEKLPPEARDAARQNRQFMHRAAAWLAAQGIDQFLDIGTGIPTRPNLHQIVQQITPTAKVVYTDNDPIVLRHAEALLISHPEGVTDYIEADVRQPDSILERARAVLDFNRPIALSLIALMHFITDEQDAHGIVRGLVANLPPGSHLVLSHAASDLYPELAEQVTAEYARSGIRLGFRTRPEVTRFFDGLDLLDPGLVTAPEWFKTAPAPAPEGSGIYTGVARVP
ncbi:MULTISPECIES: SAM-dependent methyltransferase [Streptomyces]|uniref:SAM-dependent methyltransferase n=1 Tax=Streptomyces mirabilis TaxID=68239 RepID=A0ABU3UCA7_9ACTN|nr:MULTISPECIES: SAM-dependent methyltransferase [Streptomyces]MCX4616658.1 SAM-dependent methyltransferase [Streptomyces mirabilis]MCX5354884.1 SAM-dependent methyltransferase [Streptomyces mirabilis]MDU8991545.1 SAM-dependent methyltransferase [Streptomyces mirabilis]QDN92676.1 SAM-dependent methyltransferase [Streptomyces sp. RLB3-6]QDO13498.1 SAM-dependent methyltransferase [Streptomyces sp. S1D4-23]